MANVCVLHVSQLGAEFFVFGKCEFMAFDTIGLVVLDGRETNKALLAVSLNGLLVDIEAVLIILHEDSFFDKVKKIFSALQEHIFVRLVNSVGQVNCWFFDSEEIHRVAFNFFLSLLIGEGVG